MQPLQATENLKVTHSELTWLLSKSIIRTERQESGNQLMVEGGQPTVPLLKMEYEDEQTADGNTEPDQDRCREQKSGISIPTLSGYQSIIDEVKPVMRIGKPPLVATPAHEWHIMLTVLKQAQSIGIKVMGSSRKN